MSHFYETCSLHNQIAALGNERICCTSLTKGIGQIRPIGIMSLIGDSLSNFIGIYYLYILRERIFLIFLKITNYYLNDFILLKTVFRSALPSIKALSRAYQSRSVCVSIVF